MREKSFIEVLEDKMRNQLRDQIRREIENEFATAHRTASEIDLQAARAGRFETWLATNVETTVFANKFSAKRAYGSAPQKSAPKFTKQTRQTRQTSSARKLTLEQSVSLELLRRHAGVEIREDFSELELKGAWRKAALKSHPDRVATSDIIAQTKAAALFTELTTAYEMLQTALEITPLAA